MGLMPALSLLPTPSRVTLCEKLALPLIVNLSPIVWSRFSRPDVSRAPVFCCVPGDWRSFNDPKYRVLFTPPDVERTVSNDGLWLSYSCPCQSYQGQAGVQFALASESACGDVPRHGLTAPHLETPPAPKTPPACCDPARCVAL